MLDVGQAAPDFEADSSKRTKIRLSALRGGPVVLYFYPASFTLGCSIETNIFRDRLPDFEKSGARVLGISIDDLGTQCRFAESKGLGFALIADADGRIAKSFGVFSERRRRAKRVSFVLDAEGIIRARFHHEIWVQKHISESLAYLAKQGTTG